MTIHTRIAPPVAVLGALSLAMLVSACTSAISAEGPVAGVSGYQHESHNNGESIRVSRQHSRGDTVYEVDGKRFSWNDLNPEQRQRLEQVEAKLRASEKRLRLQETDMDAVVERLEAKAEELEEVVEAMEEATIKVEKAVLNMRDLDDLHHKLDAAQRLSEAKIRVKEKELRAIERELRKIDLTEVQNIERHADELRAVLVSIAAELP